MAGPPTAGYRLRKFIRRHKTLVGGIAAVMIVSVIGTIISITFALGQARALAKAELISEYLYKGVLRPIGSNRGRQLTAQDILDISTASLEGQFEDYPLTEARIRRQLGDIYLWGLQDYSAAVDQLERSRLIRERLGIKPGVSNDLGVAYRGQGRYEEAALQLEPVVERLRQSDEDKQWHSLMWSNLTNVYKDQGRYDEAEQLMLETMDRHYAGSRLSGHLAEIYRLQGRDEEAEQIFKERVENTKTNYDSWAFGYNRCGLGRLYTTQGRYDEANDLLMEVWEKARETGSEEDLSTLYCINCLALLRREQGQYEEAESLFLKALQGRRSKLYEDHPYVLDTKNDMAVLYKEKGDYDKAEPLLLEAVNGRRLKLGDEHPHTVESLNNLIELYKAWNKPEKAATWLGDTIP